MSEDWDGGGDLEMDAPETPEWDGNWSYSPEGEEAPIDQWNWQSDVDGWGSYAPGVGAPPEFGQFNGGEVEPTPEDMNDGYENYINSQIAGPAPSGVIGSVDAGKTDFGHYNLKNTGRPYDGLDDKDLDAWQRGWRNAWDQRDETGQSNLNWTQDQEANESNNWGGWGPPPAALANYIEQGGQWPPAGAPRGGWIGETEADPSQQSWNIQDQIVAALRAEQNGEQAPLSDVANELVGDGTETPPVPEAEAPPTTETPPTATVPPGGKTYTTRSGEKTEAQLRSELKAAGYPYADTADVTRLVSVFDKIDDKKAPPPRGGAVRPPSNMQAQYEQMMAALTKSNEMRFKEGIAENLLKLSQGSPQNYRLALEILKSVGIDTSTIVAPNGIIPSANGISPAVWDAMAEAAKKIIKDAILSNGGETAWKDFVAGIDQQRPEGRASSGSTRLVAAPVR